MNDKNIINGHKKAGEEVICNYLKNIREDQVMLKILNSILDNIKDENENIDKSKRDKKLKELIMSSDKGYLLWWFV